MELYKKPVMEIMELEKVDVLTASCTCSEGCGCGGNCKCGTGAEPCGCGICD